MTSEFVFCDTCDYEGTNQTGDCPREDCPGSLKSGGLVIV